ncbi:hypothetical protein, partial [Salmonella enterica]|uniref:hypothetical protein n=1 Tax=Salmonella enterica TaxID=28901 RepID=UPI00398C3219
FGMVALPRRPNIRSTHCCFFWFGGCCFGGFLFFTEDQTVQGVRRADNQTRLVGRRGGNIRLFRRVDANRGFGT